MTLCTGIRALPNCEINSLSKKGACRAVYESWKLLNLAVHLASNNGALSWVAGAIKQGSRGQNAGFSSKCGSRMVSRGD